MKGKKLKKKRRKGKGDERKKEKERGVRETRQLERTELEKERGSTSLPDQAVRVVRRRAGDVGEGLRRVK